MTSTEKFIADLDEAVITLYDTLFDLDLDDIDERYINRQLRSVQGIVDAARQRKSERENRTEGEGVHPS